jgi:Tol biopolymer transport system component
MKNKGLFILSVFTIAVLYVSVCSVFAAAPATQKIVFTSNRDGNAEIYIMNPDGSGQVNLTRHRAADSDPVWSPTGEHILFVSDRSKTVDLYLMDANGRNVRQLFVKTLRRQHPTWAPNGKKVAYTRVDVLRGDVGIYVASINDRVEKRIASGMRPMWAPDTSEIAFISSDWLIPLNDGFGGLEFKETNIQIVDSRTHAKEELTLPGFFFVFDPAWSPDNTKIAFSGIDLNAIPQQILLQEDHNIFDEEAIYLMNRDGTEVKQVVEADGENPSDPTWVPSGDALVYQQQVGKDMQLFKVTLANGISEQLTHDGSNTGADWFDPAALSVSPQPQLLTTMWSQLKK